MHCQDNNDQTEKLIAYSVYLYTKKQFKENRPLVLIVLCTYYLFVYLKAYN